MVSLGLSHCVRHLPCFHRYQTALRHLLLNLFALPRLDNMFASVLYVLLAVLASILPVTHASLLAPTAATYAYPLSASGSRLVDTNNRTVQFRCANWPGHMETMLPEGLQWQPLASIVKLLAQPGTFNCIRLTYSVELFYLGANLTARQSFSRLNLSDTIAAVEANNPSLIDLPLLTVRDAVVAECGKAGIMVLFDNQVSKSEWCCSTTDGNGWWNDRYFNVTQWLYSLQSISAHYAKIAPNAVAYSLRNELRTDKSQADQVSDWLTYVPQGADALHAGDPNALIFVSGLGYDTDWTFLTSLEQSNSPVSTMTTALVQVNQSEWQRVYNDYASKITFETHIYSWSGYGTYTDNCSTILPAFDKRIGFPQQHNRPHVLTELGLDQDVYPKDRTDYLYFHCVSQWIVDNQLGFGIWLFGGRSAQHPHTETERHTTHTHHSLTPLTASLSALLLCISYYVRDGHANAPDTFGSTYANFSAYKNPTFLQALSNATWEPQLSVGERIGLGWSSEGSWNGAVGAVRLGVVGLLYCVLVALAVVL